MGGTAPDSEAPGERSPVSGSSRNDSENRLNVPPLPTEGTEESSNIKVPSILRKKTDNSSRITKCRPCAPKCRTPLSERSCHWCGNTGDQVNKWFWIHKDPDRKQGQAPNKLQCQRCYQKGRKLPGGVMTKEAAENLSPLKPRKNAMTGIPLSDRVCATCGKTGDHGPFSGRDKLNKDPNALICNACASQRYEERKARQREGGTGIAILIKRDKKKMRLATVNRFKSSK